MARYSMEPETRKYLKWYGFLSFTRNLSYKGGKNSLDTTRKRDTVENASKK